MLPLLWAMRNATHKPVIAQPAAFRTTDVTPCFTRLPEFPDAMETIQVSRAQFEEFGATAVAEGINYVGGCCGCNAAYIRSICAGLQRDQSRNRLTATSLIQ